MGREKSLAMTKGRAKSKPKRKASLCTRERDSLIPVLLSYCGEKCQFLIFLELSE